MRTSAHDRDAMRASGARYLETGASLPGPGEDEPLDEAPARAPAEAGVSARRRLHLAEVATSAKADSLALAAEATGAPSVSRAQIVDIANERIIGASDLQDVNYLELALAVASGVARIKLPNGAATGFMVAPGLMLTNNHVFPSPDAARRSLAQFDFQEPLGAKAIQIHSFGFEPDRFFLTSKALDFSFVAVGVRADTGRPIEAYPWVKLIEALGKAEPGDPINIIQHPLGGWKRIALRNNRVIAIPEDRKDFLYYETDTERGSSGSPCFNDQWEVIALHHQGVPKLLDGAILKKDGSLWRDTEDPRLIDWIANEGARVSAIVAAVRAADIPTSFEPARRTILEADAPNPVELFRNTESVGPHSQGARIEGRQGGQTISFTVPISFTVTVGAPEASGVTAATLTMDAASQPALDPPSVGEGTSLASEKVVIDPDWGRRKGFDTEFLGRSIALPLLSSGMRKVTARVQKRFQRAGDECVLDYHHFSVVMNAKRRFAWYSAANLDGGKRQSIPPRTRDRWFVDKRLEPALGPSIQCGEELYAAALTDRGHLTRYLDVAWGDTPQEAINASNDSFHFTNCCLQLSGFNQLPSRWQGLEQFLLEKKAAKEKRRMVVFTGPLFAATDPRYSLPGMGYAVKVPLRFWKVCALQRADGSIAATAFVLGQQDVTALPGFEAAFDVVASQTTLAVVESLTGLDFGALKASDHMAAGGVAGTLESAEFGGAARPLSDLEDIDF